ncbi:hypothetical protein [Desulfobulbus propionicus]
MNRTKRMQFCGWILFLACALLFVAEGFRSESPLLLVASLLFLLGCLFFIIPLLRSSSSKKQSTGRTSS